MRRIWSQYPAKNAPRTADQISACIGLRRSMQGGRAAKFGGVFHYPWLLLTSTNKRASQGRAFDVVHCHDWPTALVPTYLKALTAETPALAATKSVLTIHNAAHQGVFPKDTLPTIGLSWDDFTAEKIEFYGGINFLKQGIVTADAVTTVSDTYARAIQTDACGEKLEGVLAARGASLLGITNGVDYSVWNPATDPAIAARYDAEDWSNKARCRGALQKEVGLALDPTMPLGSLALPVVSGLDHDSKAQIEAMRAANVSRLLERLGHVPDDLMAQVDAKLRMHLGI